MYTVHLRQSYWCLLYYLMISKSTANCTLNYISTVNIYLVIITNNVGVQDVKVIRSVIRNSCYKNSG